MDAEIPLGRGRALTPEEQRELLQEPIFAFVASLQADGFPYVNPLWFEYRDGEFVLISKPNARLCQNLRRDPRVMLAIASPNPPYRRVLIQGRAQEADEDWIPAARRMVLRYVGPEGLKYLEATSGLPRVVFHVRPERATSWNGGGLDRSFFGAAHWNEVAPPA
jgi:PPOX class probable F420-dependent enzyme